MNKIIIEGKKKQLRGQMREWWGKLTDDDVRRSKGRAEKIIGLLQQRYGYTRQRAEREFTKRVMAVKKAVKKS